LRKKGPRRPCTLTIDVGGSHVKAQVFDARGRPVTERQKTITPIPCTPAKLVPLLKALVAPLGRFDRVSAGAPGVVRGGRVENLPNLADRGWENYDLAGALRRAFRRPVRVVNDADLHGYGAVSGKGVELVVTLGTGVGTALFEDGRPLPHLELGMARHPAPKGKAYNLYVGDCTRRRIGNKRWNRRVRRLLETMRDITHYDALYVGGGNAKYFTLPLGPEAHLISNETALAGGAALWRNGR
jgi:polyphosphate glucokinase